MTICSKSIKATRQMMPYHEWALQIPDSCYIKVVLLILLSLPHLDLISVAILAGQLLQGVQGVVVGS